MKAISDVTEVQARTAYLCLEGQRSVRRLHAAIVARYGAAPCLATLAKWIKANNWAEEARQSDEAVVERVKSTIEDRKVQVIEALSASTLTMVENIKAAVETGITPTDPQQLKAMVDAARGMLQELAEQGEAQAQYRLGFLYQFGQGVPQDYERAVMWYRKAADQGYANGQFYLGFMYSIGLGVTRNIAQGNMWFNLAAAQGHKDAIKHRERLTKSMTSAEILAAQRLAREWLEKYGK